MLKTVDSLVIMIKIWSFAIETVIKINLTTRILHKNKYIPHYYMRIIII